MIARQLKLLSAGLTLVGGLLLCGEAQAAPTVWEQRVAERSDDAEERPSGTVSLFSNDLELIDDSVDQTVGLRFTDLPLPPGAVIVSAHLQFQADETNSEATTLTIEGQAAADADPFIDNLFDISARPRTSASVSWDPPAWTAGEAGTAQRSPDIGPILQEIVARPGWVAGNAVSIIITGDGRRVAESAEGRPGTAPLLEIQYATPVEAQVSSDTDDAEENASGNVFLFSNDLELVEGSEDRAVGIRFADLPIPAGALVVSAHVQFEADESNSEATSISIQAQAANDSETFDSNPFDISSRARTSAAVVWSPPPWVVGEAGEAQKTPDLVSIVQEVVSRPGWVSGNSLTLIVTGSGKRVAESYDGGGTPPQLRVTYADTAAVRVLPQSDDAEEEPAGSVTLFSDDLEMVDDGEDQTVGLRFTEVPVPAGATIVSAYMQFQADETQSELTSLLIEGEATDDAETFGNLPFGISSRPRTSAGVGWEPPEWTQGDAGTAQQTTDIAPIIQEIVSRPGWSAGNALALVISGTGKRVAVSAEGSVGPAPLLHIEYDVAGTDSDGDGVPNDSDNCPTIANPDQTDTDGDGAGDACDACPLDAENDVDGDGVCGDVDNCPDTANPSQADADGDGLGDACDACPSGTDVDSDGICDDVDNCPDTANPDQTDTDGDGQGDACDACPLDAANDVDGDGVCGDVDNCPDTANPSQTDTDGDGPGDACDACPLDAANDVDGDGVCGDVDNCPDTANPSQTDTDGDGLGDVCDACPSGSDVDSDGICDDVDNCPDTANPDQTDADGDDLGDACDACPLDALNDADGDGVCGDVDNCPDTANADQTDTDGDDLGDVCDACPLDAANDVDGDGVCGDVDNCPDTANADQTDTDGDDLGDVCDACPLDAANDVDGDGVCGDVDNCPDTANPDQTDTDADGVGDACDLPGDGSIWVIEAAASRISLIGSTAPVPDQIVPIGPAVPPADWRTLGDLTFPILEFAFSDEVYLDQNGAPATGTHGPEMGQMSLELPVTLTDSSGGEVALVLSLTTESVDGTFPGGAQVCEDNEEDPTVCNGSRRDPITGAVKFVAITEVPASSGTIVDQELLLVELGGRIESEDTDGDGVIDFDDNCRVISNPGQQDSDGDGIGDACEGCETDDADGDGVCDEEDNCPDTVNPSQTDTDGDGAGDVCDTCPLDAANDVDGDDVCGNVDNCPETANPSQTNTDGDGLGDACDTCPLDAANDVDGDGVCGDVDNCPETANPSQTDTDGDGAGDACDDCPLDSANDVDGDGVCGDVDNCPDTANPSQTDTDDDGSGDVCDLCPLDAANDVDDDGVCGDVDNCPGTANPDQTDADGDGLGDSCDVCPLDVTNDVDDDGVCGGVDNCPDTANPSQTDADGDDLGDACDICPLDVENDVDGDRVCESVDNCPDTANPTQADTDGDGQGNACDLCPLDADNDVDDDGVCGNVDNCPDTANPTQADDDQDGLGDACDLCPFDIANDSDDDGVCGDVDNCPNSSNPSQTDSDGDDAGDACDVCPQDAQDDVDDDGVCGDTDNCPSIKNPSQADTDGDGLGNACDACSLDAANDVDGDGVCGNVDNCPDTSNPAQSDADSDGLGDACDACSLDPANDVDGDDVCGDVDNCPVLSNPDQADSDGDGLGDACDLPGGASGWVIGAAVSEISLIGATAEVPDQILPIGSAVAPADWRTLGDLNFPIIELAFSEEVSLYQDGVPATGTHDPATGQMTLEMPVILRDSSGGEAALTIEFTTESVNGVFPGGSPVCADKPTDPTVCSGSRLDPINGAVEFVAITEVPSGSGTIVDQELLLVELGGTIDSQDSDGDGVIDFEDNCRDISNPGQQDSDGDGIGDACEGCPSGDTDNDGVCDDQDNCPALANPGQADTDSDGLGDACDVCPIDPLNDADGDGVCGNLDNCPAVANPSQTDSDIDGLGDACDACPLDAVNDGDSDGVCDNVDNCPVVFNPDQADADQDGAGDACDSCPLGADDDGDGVCSDVDNCPAVANPSQTDSDGDDLGDACDGCALDPENDVDDDGVCGNVDNCPDHANADQQDSDADGIGDACDSMTNSAMWTLFPSDSTVTLNGYSRAIPAQSVPVVPALAPADWRTLENLILSEVFLAAADSVVLVQGGDALGTHDGATGSMTLDLPISITDSEGGSVSMTVALTTEQTNGLGPDGLEVCDGSPSDPSYCQGDRRDPLTGIVRLVGILQIPMQAGTIVDGELLFLELSGTIDPGDTDGDGIEDFEDNCLMDANPDQSDVDIDGVGDACDFDDDVDRDGVLDVDDNCPVVANPGQEDIDVDGMGDVCDNCADRDADGFGSPARATCPHGGIVDCDDLDGSVFPGAPELCDDRDNDCNVNVDEAICADFDVDGDLVVEGAELARLARAFGECSSPAVSWWAALDFDGNGCIDGADLAVLSSVWACSPGPICE